MKVYVVNIHYNSPLNENINRILSVDDEGKHHEVQNIIIEKTGTVVLACSNESEIPETLKKVSNQITKFEIVSVTDLSPNNQMPLPQNNTEARTMMAMSFEETEDPSEDLDGKIIFQMGI